MKTSEAGQAAYNGHSMVGTLQSVLVCSPRAAGWDQGERAVGLDHGQMVLAGEPLAVLDLHHLPRQWMERIEDPYLACRTPGIVTLSRLAWAKAGSPARSAKRLAERTYPSSTLACPGCSPIWP